MTPRLLRSGAGRCTAAVACGLALILAQIVRNPDVLDRVWAEDGAVFGRQAFDGHIWQQVGRGYAGYLVVPERLLAAPIVSVVPPARWGLWFAVSAMAVAAAAGLAVFRLSGGILRRWETRAALAVLLAVGPKMRGEWPAIANVGWPLLVAMFWVIISVRSDLWSTVIRCVIAALAVTASGLGLAFLPLAAVVLAGRDLPVVRRVLDRPSLVASDTERSRLKRADLYLLATLCVAGLLQIIGVLTAVAGPEPFRTNTTDIAKLVVVRVFGSVTVGEGFVDDAWRSWGIWFGLAALLLVVVLLIVLLRRSDSSRRTLAWVAVAYSVAIAVASLRTRGTEPFALRPHQFTYDAERYFIIPAFLVVSALAIAFERPRSDVPAAPSPAAARVPWLTTGFAGFVLVVLVVTGFGQRTKEEPSDPWSVSLRRARASCVTDPSLNRVDIPIAPAGVFRLNVPCSRLR